MCNDDPSYVPEIHQSLATCPGCSGQLWKIVLNGFAFQFDKILRFECETCAFHLNLATVQSR